MANRARLISSPTQYPIGDQCLEPRGQRTPGSFSAAPERLKAANTEVYITNNHERPSIAYNRHSSGNRCTENNPWSEISVKTYRHRLFWAVVVDPGIMSLLAFIVTLEWDLYLTRSVASPVRCVTIGMASGRAVSVRSKKTRAAFTRATKGL